MEEGRKKEEALAVRWSFGEGREQQLFWRSAIQLLPALLIALVMFYSLLPPQINVRQ